MILSYGGGRLFEDMGAREVVLSVAHLDDMEGLISFFFVCDFAVWWFCGFAVFDR